MRMRISELSRRFDVSVTADYSELVNTFGLTIKLGLTARQLKSATYPSLGSLLSDCRVCERN